MEREGIGTREERREEGREGKVGDHLERERGKKIAEEIKDRKTRETGGEKKKT